MIIGPKSNHKVKGNEIYNNLRYGTVKLHAINNQGGESLGTGFFFYVKIDEEKICPLLVTNRHMIADGKKIENWSSLWFNLNKADAAGEPLLGDVVRITLSNTPEQLRLIHPDVDLCAFPIWGVIKSIEDGGTKLFYRDIPEAFIPTKAEAETISSIEEIIMIGYPDGMSDETHNLPIVRRGITATDFKIDYEGKKEFLIDASIFKGSSGSPVLICNIGSFNNQKGELCLGDRVFFPGVQYRGEFSKFQDNIYLRDPKGNYHNSPDILSAYFNDLGFCVKSECLYYFRDEIIRQGWA